MKRFISLFLVLIFCFSLVIPAYAAPLSDSELINILSIANSDTTVFYPHASTYDLVFDIPMSYFRYVDCLFYSDAVPSSVSAFFTSYPLSVISLGDGYYRAFGNFNASGATFKLKFDFGSSVCNSLNIISCRTSSMAYNYFTLGGSWNGYTSGATFWSGTFDGVNDSVIYQEDSGGGSYVNYTYDYSLAFYPGINGDWKGYDKISLRLSFVGFTINSICASVDGINILDSVSFLDNGFYSDLRHNIDGYYYLESSNDVRFLDITLDLSNIQKTIDYYPIIKINGVYEPTPGGQQPLIVLGDCNGIIIEEYDTDSVLMKRLISRVVTGFNALTEKIELLRSNLFTLFASVYDYIVAQTDAINTNFSNLTEYLRLRFNEIILNQSIFFNDLYTVIRDRFTSLTTFLTDQYATLRSSLSKWFSDLYLTINNGFTVIFQKFNALIDGSVSAQNSASDFNNSVDEQNQEIDDLTGDLNSIDRPDINSVDISADNMVDPNVVLLATNGISDLLSNQIILRVFLMAITFSLAGFILYGKR